MDARRAGLGDSSCSRRRAVVAGGWSGALVVGNSAYAHVEQLPNAENDAGRLVAAGAVGGARVRGDDRADPGRGELTEAL